MNSRHRSGWMGAIAIAVLMAVTPAHAGKWDAIESIPGQAPTSVLVDGKERIYFRVAPGKPLVVPIDGPVRLRIVSRAEIDHPGAVASYVLTVSENGREIEHNATESSASDRVTLSESRAAIGKSRRMTVDVSAGAHRLTLATTGAAIYLRLQRGAPPRGDEPTVSLTPIDALRSVLVVEGEKSIPYYSVWPGKPVRFRVVGPTTLDIISRLDFDATMRGTHSYRLRLAEGSQLLKQVEFKTSKASTASYSNLKDRIPSKFDRFRVVIPNGTHDITVDLAAPAGGSAEIHARIPQPVVGGEE